MTVVALLLCVFGFFLTVIVYYGIDSYAPWNWGWELFPDWLEWLESRMNDFFDETNVWGSIAFLLILFAVAGLTVANLWNKSAPVWLRIAVLGVFVLYLIIMYGSEAILDSVPVHNSADVITARIRLGNIYKGCCLAVIGVNMVTLLANAICTFKRRLT